MPDNTRNQIPKLVAVFGLGYVGLPLVRACVNSGHSVIGFDIDREKISSLENGTSYIDDVADFEVVEWLSRGFQPTFAAADIAQADVFIICVPTPLSKSGGPDLRAVEAATRTIEVALRARSALTATIPLVILESTTYPGTTEEIVQPILEENGLKALQDFHLAFSPERIDPGNKTWTFENTPKVVGGLSEKCADAAEAFYSLITTRVVRTKGLKEAEMAKLLENTYRHVNIALVNELAKLSYELGIDIWDVIEAAETKPYGFQSFRPGPGVGGHCIPIDPNYLSHRVKSELGQPFRFVELAQEVNASMPTYVVSRLQGVLNTHGIAINGASVLLFGVAYKADISDVRDSPAVAVVRQLRRLGAIVYFTDPYVEEFIVDGQSVLSKADEGSTEIFDAAVILQAHSPFNASVIRDSATYVLDVSSGITATLNSSWTRL